MTPASDQGQGQDSVPVTDDIEAYVNTPPPNGYLSDLPLAIKRLPYHSLQQCMDARETEWQRQYEGKEEACEWMLFTGVDAQTFKRDFLEMDDSECEGRRDVASYNAANQLLLIRMPESMPHAIASAEFICAMAFAIRPMGLSDKVLLYGGVFVDLSPAAPAGIGKAPDTQICPRRRPPGRNRHLPSGGVDVASEPRTKLPADAGQWLHETGGEVKVAITLSIGRNKRELQLQKWVMGARAHREQCITMTLVDEKVQFGAESELRITFQELMLREPLEPREKDITITREALEMMATNIFDAQEEDETIGNGYLCNLSSPIKRLPYHNLQQCMDAREAEWKRQLAGEEEACEWMLFTGVDKQTFERDFFYSHEKEVWWALASYNAKNHVLLAKLPKSRPHAVAEGEFMNAMTRAIAPMGLTHKVRILSYSAVELSDDLVKSPDAQYYPEPSPAGRDPDCPTVVLEVAFSEPRTKLHEDVAQWLYETAGEVKVVVTIFISSNKRELELEKWVMNKRGVRHREQCITMTLVDDKVQLGAEFELRITFQELMLRDPLEPCEKDIVITQEELEMMATDVWDEQDLERSNPAWPVTT